MTSQRTFGDVGNDSNVNRAIINPICHSDHPICHSERSEESPTTRKERVHHPVIPANLTSSRPALRRPGKPNVTPARLVSSRPALRHSGESRPLAGRNVHPEGQGNREWRANTFAQKFYDPVAIHRTTTTSSTRPQQRVEPRLHKVDIMRQRIPNTSLLHKHETRTIHQAPALVWPRGVTNQSRVEKRAG